MNGAEGAFAAFALATQAMLVGFFQMFMWWPLWDFSRAAWGAFLALFIPSTALNIRGHFGNESIG